VEGKFASSFVIGSKREKLLSQRKWNERGGSVTRRCNSRRKRLSFRDRKAARTARAKKRDEGVALERPLIKKDAQERCLELRPKVPLIGEGKDKIKRGIQGKAPWRSERKFPFSEDCPCLESYIKGSYTKKREKKKTVPEKKGT